LDRHIFPLPVCTIGKTARRDRTTISASTSRLTYATLLLGTSAASSQCHAGLVFAIVRRLLESCSASRRFVSEKFYKYIATLGYRPGSRLVLPSLLLMTATLWQRNDDRMIASAASAVYSSQEAPSGDNRRMMFGAVKQRKLTVRNRANVSPIVSPLANGRISGNRGPVNPQTEWHRMGHPKRHLPMAGQDRQLDTAKSAIGHDSFSHRLAEHCPRSYRLEPGRHAKVMPSVPIDLAVHARPAVHVGDHRECYQS
jgi:hypothetical protein